MPEIRTWLMRCDTPPALLPIRREFIVLNHAWRRGTEEQYHSCMPDSPTRDEPEADADLEPIGATDWARLAAMTDEEAHQNALADPDNPPLTDEQLSRMRRVPNPQEIREQLGLTQREFAKQFEIALGTLRDWEQGARRPDSTARSYLRVIEQNPEAVREALARSRPNAIPVPVSQAR